MDAALGDGAPRGLHGKDRAQDLGGKNGWVYDNTKFACSGGCLTTSISGSDDKWVEFGRLVGMDVRFQAGQSFLDQDEDPTRCFNWEAA